MKSTKVTGKDISQISRSSNSAINKIWNEINKLSRMIDTQRKGAQKLDESGPEIRLVQDGDNYYIEAKFENGWARISQSMNLIDRRS